MKMISFAKVSWKVIAEVAQVEPGENVLLLTDTKVSQRISTSLAEAVLVGGGIPSILVIIPPEYPGAPLPATVEQAVKGAEVFGREKAYRRLISMPGIMEGSFTEGGGTVDLKELKAITKRVSRTLQGRRRFELKSDKGTDATFLSRGKAFSCFAQLPKPTGFAMFPDGESGIALEEKSLEGRIVMDIF